MYSLLILISAVICSPLGLQQIQAAGAPTAATTVTNERPNADSISVSLSFQASGSLSSDAVFEPTSSTDFLPQPRETLALMDCTLGSLKSSELWWVNSTDADQFISTQSSPIKTVATQGSFIPWLDQFTFPTMSKFTSDDPNTSYGIVPRGEYWLQGNGSMIKDTEVGVEENQILFVVDTFVYPRNTNGQQCHYIGYIDFFITE